MLELTTIPELYQATVEGRRRHHVLMRTVCAPAIGDTARVAEVLDGHYTGKACFARITWVDTITGGALGPMHVLSLDVRMSVERMPALGGTPTPVPTG